MEKTVPGEDAGVAVIDLLRREAPAIDAAFEGFFPELVSTSGRPYAQR